MKGQVRLKFPERSCKDCKFYPCILGHENLKSDFAKYGCTIYDGRNSESQTCDKTD